MGNPFEQSQLQSKMFSIDSFMLFAWPLQNDCYSAVLRHMIRLHTILCIIFTILQCHAYSFHIKRVIVIKLFMPLQQPKQGLHIHWVILQSFHTIYNSSIQTNHLMPFVHYCKSTIMLNFITAPQFAVRDWVNNREFAGRYCLSW